MKSYKQIQIELSQNARTELKAGLAQCTDDQQMLFKKMYAKGHLETPISEVVDDIEEEKLDWAMQQVQRTLEANQ